MKTLICSLAAILSVALSSTVLAEETTDRGQEITGTVISVNHKQRSMVLDAGKVRGSLELILFSDDLKAPKVGEKVRVHCWYHNRGRYFTDKIEKLGNGDGDSKKE
jgi:ribosomal protein S1